MKTLLDFQEESFKAGETLAELVTSSNAQVSKFVENLTYIECHMKVGAGDDDIVRVNYFKDCKYKKEVFCCDCMLRKETQDKLFDYLSTLYKESEKERLQATIDNAQAKLKKLQATIKDAEAKLSK